MILITPESGPPSSQMYPWAIALDSPHMQWNVNFELSYWALHYASVPLVRDNGALRSFYVSYLKRPSFLCYYFHLLLALMYFTLKSVYNLTFFFLPAKRTEKQVFLSCSLSPDSQLIPLVEKKIIEEMKSHPEYFWFIHFIFDIFIAFTEHLSYHVITDGCVHIEILSFYFYRLQQIKGMSGWCICPNICCHKLSNHITLVF